MTSTFDEQIKALGIDMHVTPMPEFRSAAEALAWEVEVLRVRYDALLNPPEPAPLPDNVIAFPKPGSDEPGPTESTP